MGLKKTCVKYAKAKGGVNRCARFESASKVGKHPKCGIPAKNMRSPGLLRAAGQCSRSAARKHSGAKKTAARRGERKRR